MTKLMLGLMTLVILILIHLGIMIFGWGLEVKSWFWVVGMYFISWIISTISVELIKKNE